MTATIAAKDLQPGQMVFDYALNRPIEVDAVDRRAVLDHHNDHLAHTRGDDGRELIKGPGAFELTPAGREVLAQHERETTR